jgi:hypothetical protein
MATNDTKHSDIIIDIDINSGDMSCIVFFIFFKIVKCFFIHHKLKDGLPLEIILYIYSPYLTKLSL